MSKRKFKVGDRVVIKPTSVYGPKNTVGTVIDYGETKYTVKFTNGFVHSFRGAELDTYVEVPKKEVKKEVKKEEPKTAIVIYQRGRDVVAFDKRTGQKCYAHCHPDDAFNFTEGAKIAFDRLMGRDVHKGEEPVCEKEFDYLDKFEQGKTYVFDKEIYKSCYEDEWCPAWVDVCHGKEVGERTKDIGRIDRFLVTPKWCREVTDEKAVRTEAMKDFEDLLNLLKAML